MRKLNWLKIIYFFTSSLFLLMGILAVLGIDLEGVNEKWMMAIGFIMWGIYGMQSAIQRSKKQNAKNESIQNSPS